MLKAARSDYIYCANILHALIYHTDNNTSFHKWHDMLYLYYSERTMAVGAWRLRRQTVRSANISGGSSQKSLHESWYGSVDTDMTYLLWQKVWRRWIFFPKLTCCRSTVAITGAQLNWKSLYKYQRYIVFRDTFGYCIHNPVVTLISSRCVWLECHCHIFMVWRCNVLELFSWCSA